ncbi:MAG: hypothetical protein ACREQB_02595, partial [Candidatus Binataceae bacterium]
MNEFPNTGKFAPLTPQELAAVDATSHDKEGQGECVLPVPADAPPMPATHPKWGGVPSGRWPYLDASGAPLFEVWRFDPPGERKQFPCLSLWRYSNRIKWRWAAVPELRPLYGLDKLAARPDASVVICEGEKAADAVARIFPGHVCITSPGGSQAAGKTDWAPLAGRRVLIWPDADEPGSKYAEQVAAISGALGCEVSIIDAVALAGMAPDGSQREAAKGWDAADASGEWQDLVALRKAAHGLAKPFEATSRHDSTEAGSEPCDTDREIARLAKLRVVEYEKERNDAATKLGIRVASLDKLVAAERPKEDKPGQGRPLELPEPEP